MRIGLKLALATAAAVYRGTAQAPWDAMDYGNWLASSVTLPWSRNGEDLDGVTLKGITFRLGPDAACFDTGELRWSAAWTGGWLKLMGTPFDGTHRPPENSRPAATGEIIFGSSHRPGWAVNDDWRDLRAEPYTPLPRAQAKYLGTIRADGRGVLHYSVGDTVVFETPWSGSSGGLRFFGRALAVGPHRQKLALLAAEDRLEYRDQTAFDGRQPEAGVRSAFMGRMATAVGRFPAGARWQVEGGTRMALSLPPSTSIAVFSVMVGRVAEDRRGQWAPEPDSDAEHTVAALAAARNFRQAKVSFSPRFVDSVSAPGHLGQPSRGYAVDTLPLPEKNPWKSWIRPSGFDFFEDGKSAAVCTWSGDVWLVTGIDDSLAGVSWRRLAAGLFQPLGLKIVHSKVYVLCRDEIVRLDDFNGDGEPDEMACFNNDVSVTPNFHEFALDLQADSNGNFYFTKGGPLLGTDYWDPIGAHNGCVVKVSADGMTLERYATGLRAPNGSGMGPHDELTCSDNEGIWTPVCRLNWVRPGGFYGALGLDHRDPPPTSYDPPLCWLPYAIDNSSGSQVWADPRFGPLGGELIFLSYGKCRAFHVLRQTVKGVVQGGVTPLPWRFDSSAMRARANPRDGSLWVAGLKGWQTTAAHDGALQRVRVAGAPDTALAGFQVVPDGFELQFSGPIDTAAAADPTNWDVQCWNYLWSHVYGSDLYSVVHPGQKTGRKGELKGDPIPVLAATPSKDGRSVRLRVAKVQPVMQLALRATLRAASGQEMPVEYYGTINTTP